MAILVGPFYGVSDTKLRRRLDDSGDRRRLEALSCSASRKVRRDEAMVARELLRRGAPLEDRNGVSGSATPTGPETRRPALRPPSGGSLQLEDQCAPAPAPAPDRAGPGPGMAR